MKITISFTQKEKETMMQIASTTGIVQPDKDEHTVGNFGEFKYNSSENKIIFDFKEGFIEATSQLIANCINMVKSMVGCYKMYESSWLKDCKDLTKKESEPEVVSDCNPFR